MRTLEPYIRYKSSSYLRYLLGIPYIYDLQRMDISRYNLSPPRNFSLKLVESIINAVMPAGRLEDTTYVSWLEGMI